MAQADFDTSTVTDEPESRPGGIPLFAWVIGAAVLAVPVGLFAPSKPYGVDLAAQFEVFPHPHHPGLDGPGHAPGVPGDPQRDRD